MKQARNSIMRGASGKLGDELVFRQKNGKTIISLPPVTRPDNPTDGQKEIREKFVRAAKYAQKAIADQVTGSLYKSLANGDLSPYNVAFGDYFNAPEILSVDAVNYSGSPNGTINIMATDDGRVTTVYVSVLDSTGEVVEEGLAINSPTEAKLWTYTSTTSNSAVAGGTLRITATDLPGNETLLEQVLS